MSDKNYLELKEGLQKSTFQDMNTKSIADLLNYSETQIKKANREAKAGNWDMPGRFDRAVLFALMLGRQNGFESLHEFIPKFSKGSANIKYTPEEQAVIDAQMDLVEVIDSTEDGAENADQKTQSKAKEVRPKKKRKAKTADLKPEKPPEIEIDGLCYPATTEPELLESIRTLKPERELLEYALGFKDSSPLAMTRLLKTAIDEASQ